MHSTTYPLLLLCASLTVSTPVDLQKRIIGGATCNNTERLFHVKLNTYSATHNSLCGGSLISDRWILTAAHCWKDGWTMKAKVGVHPGPGTEVTITDPPEFYSDTTHRRHDIMLLKLPNTYQIKPATLPNTQDCENRPQSNAQVQIAGHASDSTSSFGLRRPGETPTLQCAMIPVYNCQEVKACFTASKKTLLQYYSYQHWFCGKSFLTDISPGDSGGGVVYGDKLYGIIAFTLDKNKACNKPAAFMDVCDYMTWITGVINKP